VKVLGVNAVFHDPAAALVVDGHVVAAAEEERFTRRKHGREAPVAFAAWELPERSMAWCLTEAGLTPADLDVVTYSYDPRLVVEAAEQGLDDPWDWLRTRYAEQAPEFLATALPGLDSDRVMYVPHHVAHAASAALAAPMQDSAVLVLDGRGEAVSHLSGTSRQGKIDVLASQELPHSLGLFYEQVTAHLGFKRSNDEYKVMALASYGQPRFAAVIRDSVHATGDGGFRTHPVDWSALVPMRTEDADWTQDHADLAASAQQVLEEVMLDLTQWLHQATGDRALTMAGGVALNCVANSKIAASGTFDDVWVQPAAGDAGTSLGGALYAAALAGDDTVPMPGADLGRSWTDEELQAWLVTARIPFDRPRDIADTVAQVLAGDGVVAWFQGASEFGPRALGHRSLMAHPGRAENLDRLNEVKGRESFRPVAPMVLLDRAPDIFIGPIPSPYMLFVHDVRPEWRDRIPAVVHVDGTARIQTVDPAEKPRLARMLSEFEARTGLPVVVNTSLNTAGRPMVDDPRDALELFGSAPVDLLAIGPFAVHRKALA
jgi:carbamoyltransferase